MTNVSIKIQYKLRGSSDWCEIQLDPENYFDLCPDEEIEWDCIPIFNDTRDYLEGNKNLLQYVKTIIVDHKANVRKCFVETYWNNGENSIIEKDISGSVSLRETIINVKLRESNFTWELIRFHKEDNIPILSYHGLFKDNEDGSEEELIIYRISDQAK